jgi:hypothetical protein
MIAEVANRREAGVDWMAERYCGVDALELLRPDLVAPFG